MVGGTGKNAINKLGEAQIQAFIRKAKAGTATKSMLSDGGGMYLEVTGSGTPVWRLCYRIGARERLYTIGTLAAFSLDEARTQRQAAKALIDKGRDPVKDRRVLRRDIRGPRCEMAGEAENCHSSIRAGFLNEDGQELKTCEFEHRRDSQ